MKYQDTTEIKKYKNGLYVSAIPSKMNVKFLLDKLKMSGFKFLIPADHAHITLVQSKKLPKKDFKIKDINADMRFKRFTIFKHPRFDQHILTAEMSSPELDKLHNFYKNEYDLPFKFKEFKPHISLSYNLERSLNIKIKNPKQLEELFNNTIKDIPKKFSIDKQHYQELNENEIINLDENTYGDYYLYELFY